MASKVNNNIKMEELTAIEKCPELTDYIVRTKIKDVKKTSLIICMIMAILSFASGVLFGLNINKISTPQNVIEVRVDSNQNNPTADAEGK